MDSSLELGEIIKYNTLGHRTHEIVAHASNVLGLGTNVDPVVHEIIIDFLESFDIEISSVMAEIIAETMGVPHKQAMSVASAVLFVRCASVIHDLIEGSEGKDETFRDRGLDKLMILAGDLLIASATQIIATHGSSASLTHLGTGFAHLIEASAQVILTASTDSFDEVRWLHAISPKSGVPAFVGEAAIVGAMTAGLDPISIHPLKTFAESFGAAFQLGMQASELESLFYHSGLQGSHAVRIGEIGLPLSYAFTSCTHDEAELMITSLAQGDVTPFFIIAERYNIINLTKAEAGKYLHEALDLLPSLSLRNPEALLQILEVVL